MPVSDVRIDQKGAAPDGAPNAGGQIKVKKEPKGLGGWLVLPIIGLFLDLVSALFGLGGVVVSQIANGYLGHMFDPNSASYNLNSAFSTLFVMFEYIVLTVFSITLIVVTFRKRGIAPRLFVIYYICYFVIALYGVVSNFAEPRQDDIERLTSWIGIIVGMVLAAAVPSIWIPYFLRSKRVKNTFGNLPVEPQAAADAPAIGKPIDLSNPYAYLGGEGRDEE